MFTGYMYNIHNMCISEHKNTHAYLKQACAGPSKRALSHTSKSTAFLVRDILHQDPEIEELRG